LSEEENDANGQLKPHLGEEVREAVVGVLESVQLLRDPPGHQHALPLLTVYDLRNQAVTCSLNAQLRIHV